jgi:hypothetical protein
VSFKDQRGKGVRKMILVKFNRERKCYNQLRNNVISLNNKRLAAPRELGFFSSQKNIANETQLPIRIFL